MKRRDFICKSFVAGSLISNPIFAYRGQDPFFEIGLAQWSLNKSLKSGLKFYYCGTFSKHKNVNSLLELFNKNQTT